MMSIYENDIILLEHVKSGSTEAFTWFYTRYRSELTALAAFRLGDEAEAKDLVQEFFADFWGKKLFTKIKTTDNGKVCIKPYISKIIHNRCMDKLEERQRRQQTLNNIPQQHTDPSPDNRLTDNEREKELGHALKAAIAAVPSQSAKVFILAYVQHKSRNEIANEMGISPHTVKNQLARALKILRKELKISY